MKSFAIFWYFVGASLHQCMTPHGPDTQTFEAASSANLKPQKLSSDALAFMFEVCFPNPCFPQEGFFLGYILFSQ